jgi:1-acyl-sn-glycerol-3-phosphate acyltransferase
MNRLRGDPAELYSPRLLGLFRRYLRHYLARNFNAVRVDIKDAPVALDRATVFYVNHPSWWDPAVLMYVLGSAYPGRRFFGPMDAVALERYALLRRFGLFGIDRRAHAGAAEFIRQSRNALAQADAALCVTAQGAFVDPRVRPIRLERGVAHLLASRDAEQAVPIAIEYPFWLEKKPEALIRFGSALRGAGTGVDRINAELERALERTVDELAAASTARDAGAFAVWVDGTNRGVGGLYDALKRLRAAATGGVFDPSHESSVRR